MNDVEIKKLNGFLSKTLKMEAEDMASLYNEAGELVSLTAAEKADTSRVAKLKEDNDSQYKRGQKEVASKLEAKLKDKYDIESELTGVELVDFLLTEEIKKVKTDTSDITKHPDYLKRELEFGKSMKNKDKEWQEKLNVKEKELERQLVFSEVAKKAISGLDIKRPLLPNDTKKAQKWRDRYLDEFKGYDYRKDDKDFVVIKDGEPLKDGHGNIVYLDDLIESTASENFEFETAEQRSSPGNKPVEGKSGEVTVKDENDYVEKTRQAKTPQERIELLNAYQKLKK